MFRGEVGVRGEVEVGPREGAEADPRNEIQGVKDQEVRKGADGLEVRTRESLRAEIREDQIAEESLLLLRHQERKEWSRKMLLIVPERRTKICLLMKVLTGLN